MAESKAESLLSKKEIKRCQQVMADDKGLAGRRAKALIALNEGENRASASEISGLTLGQIQYLLRIFKTKCLMIFPGQAPDTAMPSTKKDKGSKKKTEKSKRKKEVKDKKKEKTKKSKSSKPKSSKKDKKKEKDKKKKSAKKKSIKK